MTPTERAMTPEERIEMQAIVAALPTRFRLGREVAHNIAILWAIGMALFMAGWAAVAWIARTFARVEFGWSSEASMPISLAGFAVSGAFALWQTVGWVRQRKDPTDEANADLAGGVVNELRYAFTAARVFQEPEHGGLIYLLRTADDRVFAAFDLDSQDLGARGENPRHSPFRPRATLRLSRAPRTQYVLERAWSGEVLATGEPEELQAHWSRWPGPDEHCDCTWDQVDARFGTKG